MDKIYYADSSEKELIKKARELLSKDELPVLDIRKTITILEYISSMAPLGIGSNTVIMLNGDEH